MEVIRFALNVVLALLILGGVCWGALTWVRGRREKRYEHLREARHLRKVAQHQQKQFRG